MKKVTVIMILLAVGFCGLAADRAEAETTVTLTISADVGAGTWDAFAAVTGDANDGIADFIFDVWGTGGANVTGSTNEAPEGKDPTTGDDWGFIDSLASDGVNGIGIQDAQGTIYVGGNDPDKDANVLIDIGISAGSRLSYFVPPYTEFTVNWAAPVLLASGTFSGSVGQLHVGASSGGAVGFSLLDDGWSGPGNQFAADNVVAGAVAVPEPATMTALALGGLALLRRRRK